MTYWYKKIDLNKVVIMDDSKLLWLVDESVDECTKLFAKQLSSDKDNNATTFHKILAKYPSIHQDFIPLTKEEIEQVKQKWPEEVKKFLESN